MVVADHPKKRHPSKRATFQRVGNKKKATINAKIWRFEVHSTQAKDDTPEKVSQLKAAMKTLSSAENAMSKMLPPHFADAL